MNDGTGELFGQVILGFLGLSVALGLMAGFFVGRRGRCLPGFLAFLGVTGGLLYWGYSLVRVDPAERARWEPPHLQVVLPTGYHGPAWLLFDGHHPAAPKKLGVIRCEIPAGGAAVYGDPGAPIEHARVELTDPQGRALQLQLLPSGNFDGEQGLVRYVGLFVGSPYECQQYSEAHSEDKPWLDAYRQLARKKAP